MTKKKRKYAFPFLVVALCALFTVLMCIVKPTTVINVCADGDISDPSQWASWTQYVGPWGQQWGTKPGSSNVGCYLTAIAIQGARAGMTKTQAGKTWNPLNLNTRGDQTGSTAGDNGFKMEQVKGNFSPDICGAGSMGGQSKVDDAINQLTKAGLFPIIHVSQGAGYPWGTHYMAFRKFDGKNITVYDPALYQGKTTADDLGGWGKLYPMVAWVEGWGGGKKNFSQASSPAQKGQSGQKDEGVNGGSTNANSSSQNNQQVNGSGGGAPIHVLFNPFRTQMNNGAITQVGANTDISPLNNAEIMAIRGANWFMLLEKVETASMYIMIFLIAYFFADFILLMFDSFGGGYVQGVLKTFADRVPLINKIFFPKGLFLGIVKEGSTFKMTAKFGVEFAFMVLVFALSCTGGLSQVASFVFQKFSGVPL